MDLSWASSKLEGNTYSRLDTQNLIEFDQIAKGKDVIETQMILNHKAAIRAVQTVIKGLQQPSPAVIAELAQDHAEKADQAAFREMLTAALGQVHEGSIARYRLRRSEYIAWQHAQTRA